MRTKTTITGLIFVVLMLGAGSQRGRVGTESASRASGLLHGNRMAALPKVMLWAWERPEDLSFIDPADVGIAFLSRTVYLSGDRVMVRPRLQPLRAPQDSALVAVVRLESSRFRPPRLSDEQRSLATKAIAEAASIPGVDAIQMDFDANVAERSFYRQLLLDLRRRLPASIGLSITALASWCLGDNWMDGLPVDEAVPMLFRMGPDRRDVLLRLGRGGDFRTDLCRQSIGLAVDEPIPKLPAGRRLYLFHPRAWTAEAFRNISNEVPR